MHSHERLLVLVCFGQPCAKVIVRYHVDAVLKAVSMFFENGEFKRCHRRRKDVIHSSFTKPFSKKLNTAVADKSSGNFIVIYFQFSSNRSQYRALHYSSSRGNNSNLCYSTHH